MELLKVSRHALMRYLQRFKNELVQENTLDVFMKKNPEKIKESEKEIIKLVAESDFLFKTKSKGKDSQTTSMYLNNYQTLSLLDESGSSVITLYKLNITEDLSLNKKLIKTMIKEIKTLEKEKENEEIKNAKSIAKQNIMKKKLNDKNAELELQISANRKLITQIYDMEEMHKRKLNDIADKIENRKDKLINFGLRQ